MRLGHASSISLACLFTVQSAAAQGLIFADDFENGRTCWVWSASQDSRELCYDVPHVQPPPVGSEVVDSTMAISTIDLIIGMDTTGSMGDEIQNLKDSIGTLIDEINLRIPDSAFAISGYDDFPCCGYGSAPDGDRAFYLLHRAMTASTQAGKNSIAAAVDTFETHHGVDTPESGWEMVFQVATGFGNGTGPNAVPPFDSATAPPALIPTNEEIGEEGGVGFRPGAIPLIVWITDAPSHNSAATGNNYGPIPGVTPADSTQAVNQMNARGGKIIGVYSGENALLDLNRGATTTFTEVTPDAWGMQNRPPGCPIDECCTGVYGTGVPPIDNHCPLVFAIESDGTGLGVAVIDGVERLIDSGTAWISATLTDDPSDGVDTLAAFVDRVEALETAPAPCTQGLVAVDENPPGDGVPDTFVDVPPGSITCFELVLKTNDTVTPTLPPSVFGATFEIVRDFVTVTDQRPVFFRVPD